MPNRILILILGGLLAIVPCQAQEPAHPLPAPPDPPSTQPASEAPKPGKTDRRPAADRERHERATRELIQQLPLESRRQVVQAMRKVWADEDVRAAREGLRQAVKSYRRTLREAMEEADPDVRDAMRPLLDHFLKTDLEPGKSGASRPDTSAASGPPRFLRLLGLSGERATALTVDERALLGSARERIMADPRIRQAAAAFAARPDQPGGRAQALRELRRTTRAVAVELEPRLQPLLEKAAAPQ